MPTGLNFKAIERASRWPLALPAAIMAIGLVATLVGGLLMARTVEARERLRFDGLADQANGAVADRLETYVAVLRAGAGLFAASREVSLGEFRAFARRMELEKRYPGIQGIGYSVWVRPGEEAQVVAEMRRQGLAGFRFRPAVAPAEAHAIVYLEPGDDRNRAALGFNMHSSPVRREAMDRARDTAQPAMSGRVQLIQEIHTEKQAGFLIYEAVYGDGDPPATVAGRRAALRGFVYAPFRTGDFMRRALPAAKTQGLEYAVYDGVPDEANLLHRSAGEAAISGGFEARRTLEVAGRGWTIVYRAAPAWADGTDRYLPVGFIAVGSLGTLLIAAGAWRQAQAQLAAEREIVARKAAEARQKLLLDELNHRVKNTLATVQSIAAQSLRHGTDVNSVRQTFEARLIALSQAHNLLTRDNWRGVDLADLAETELGPYGGAAGERISLEGPEVWLSPNTGVALGMALHELATNAVKYGALSGEAGRVLVRWSVIPGASEAKRLQIVWREEGGPPVAQPTRHGFGSRLITGGLAHQLDGDVELEFAPDGVVCKIAFDLPATTADSMLQVGAAA